MSNFQAFASAIALRFQLMSQGELFHADVSGDDLWAVYLESFPAGTNPIYRVRTEHDGSYDRNFVRKLGNVVSINADGTWTTIWDVDGLPYPYQAVADAMRATVLGFGKITDLFRTKERTVGYESTIERLDNGSTHRWYHFHAKIADRHIAASPAEVQGEARTTIEVMERGYKEITPDAVQTVLDLIAQNSLYRGAEFEASLKRFQREQDDYSDSWNAGDRNSFLWSNLRSPSARLRNTAIGTLLQDLSAGMDLEAAVRRWETVMAPANYKRPTALITPAMIEKATKDIAALGLESALERRHARLSDLSVNNVLWVDNDAQKSMRDGIAGLLMSEVKPTTPKGNATAIGIDEFASAVLPTVVSMELFVANKHQGNLMSLTAPVHADAGSLFKWGNNFAWSYNGNITDSIKEKVKAAGGNVNAKLRVSLAWFNHDDLDLHAVCPDGHVFYGDKDGKGGRNNGAKNNILDVDMNAGGGTTRTPVENLSWVAPKDGRYGITVHQYCKRESADVGFTLELENAGVVMQYSYPHAVSGSFNALQFNVRNGVVSDLIISPKLIGRPLAQQKWGITTEQFVKVNTVLNSPNHWDGEHTGNKHWFFILEGCKNDEPVRGIYNEFLKPELEVHRKVFEVLGNKTKCPPSDEQLSGLGFSSTQRNIVTAKVTTTTGTTRLYDIHF